MKHIFINRFFFPDHSATSQILTELASELAQDGQEVHIVTSRLRYENPEANLPAEEAINKVHIHRVASTTFGRHSLPGRLIDYFSFYISATLSLYKLARKGDTVVAKTDPPLISVPAALVCRLRSAKLINWLQDLFPEVAVALGVGKLPSILVRSLTAIRNSTLRQATTNVVIGEVMRQRLVEQGIPPEKIIIVHNWAVGPEITPIKAVANPLRKEWGLHDKFVVGYSGNLGRAHDYETMLGAMRLLKENKDIVFLYIGSGANLEKLKTAVEAEQLDNVIFKPYQPIERLPESLCVPDLHWISLRPSLEGFIVPSKFYGILAAGRSMLHIGSTSGELARQLSKHECGITVETGQSQVLAECIENACYDTDLVKQQSDNARTTYQQIFNKEKSLSTWKIILRS